MIQANLEEDLSRSIDSLLLQICRKGKEDHFLMFRIRKRINVIARGKHSILGLELSCKMLPIFHYDTSNIHNSIYTGLMFW